MKQLETSLISPRGEAIVVGGSIAGILAARVLVDYFSRVTLIERDHYPEGPVFRPGVPQGHHTHVLLLEGQRVMEEIFPGIRQKLLAHGAIETDFVKDYLIYTKDWCITFPSQLRGYTCTRPLIEWQLRQELMKYDALRLIEGYEVTGLLTDSEKRAVTGVRMFKRDGTAPTARETILLEADLVVDASGRSSRLPQWLQELGYEAPSETKVNAFLGYASRVYAAPADAARNWQGMMIESDPPRLLRGGMIWPGEGGRWMVSLGGAGKDYPPTEEEAFLAYVRDLVQPTMYEALKDAQPLSPIYGYRSTENRWRHIERMKRFPERLLVIGDSYCAFNPIYGQGMTVAALDARALRHILSRWKKKDWQGLASAFHKKLARVNKTPWQMAVSADYQMPGVEGKKQHWLSHLQDRYLESVKALIISDKEVREAFSSVLHLIQPPSVLLRPSIIAKVLFRRSARIAPVMGVERRNVPVS